MNNSYDRANHDPQAGETPRFTPGVHRDDPRLQPGGGRTTLTRLAFALAFFMLLAGVWEGRSFAASWSPNIRLPNLTAPVVAIGTTRIRASRQAEVTRRAQPTRSAHTPQAHAQHRAVARHRRIRRRRVPVAVPPLTGMVSLQHGGIGMSQARPGTSIQLTYVIDNGTRRPLQVGLGASIKPSALGWSAAIADTANDSVTVVPPGISVQSRPFVLPAVTRSGLYDVAWGVRDVSSGRRLGLLGALQVLTIVR